MPIGLIAQILGQNGGEETVGELLSQRKRELRDVQEPSFGAILDAACRLRSRKQLSRARHVLFMAGIPLNIAEIVCVFVWAKFGIWQWFALWLAANIAIGALLIRSYARKTAYICPQCHAVFRLPMREMLFTRHTPETRWLRSPQCGRTDFCT